MRKSWNGNKAFDLHLAGFCRYVCLGPLSSLGANQYLLWRVAGSALEAQPCAFFSRSRPAGQVVLCRG